MFATPEIIARDAKYFNLNVPIDVEEFVTVLAKFKQDCENKWVLAFPRTEDKLNFLLEIGRTLGITDILISDAGSPDTPDPLTQLLMLEELGGIDLDIALGLLSAYPSKYLASWSDLATLQGILTERTAVCWFDGNTAVDLPTTLGELLACEGANIGLVPANTDAVLLLMRQGSCWHKEFIVTRGDFDLRALALRHSGLVFADLVRLGRCDVQIDMALSWKSLNVNEMERVLQLVTHLTLYLSAILCGALKVLVERSFKYARSRHSFDKPLIQHQAVAMRLADMLTARDVCHLALDQGGREIAQNRFDYTLLTQLIFLLGEAVPSITRDAIQIHGGHGYVEEMPLAKGYRDCRTLMSHLQFIDTLIPGVHDAQ